jgi:hypothetical protein
MTNETSKAKKEVAQRKLTLFEGLCPAVNLQLRSVTWGGTTDELASALVERFMKGLEFPRKNDKGEIVTATLEIPEIDNFVFTPKMSRDIVGATFIEVLAYFNADKGRNIFINSRNNQRNGGNVGRVSVLNGASGGGNGRFKASPEFERVIKPFCLRANDGSYILKFRSVEGRPNICSLELDFNALMCLILGIAPDDQYDYKIRKCNALDPKGGNFDLDIETFRGNVSRGRNTNIDYTQLKESRFNRVNGGRKNNNGNRQY